MKQSNNIPHPDFDQMWNSIQQDQLKDPEREVIVPLPRKRKRFALAVGLSVALMATPVYAALNYDWSDILSYREGIQSALDQGLGQKLEYSITTNDVTLTVHTAFIDDNRTFLLYSLKPEASLVGNDVTFDQIGLKDHNGNLIEGNYVHKWNEELGVFQGYFETDWIVKGQTANVEFIMKNIQFIGEVKKYIDYDPNNLNTQVFPIQKDGIDSVTLQAFKQPGEKTLLQSSVSFTDTNRASESWVRIEALNSMNQPIKEADTPSFGTPGAKGEYLNQQLFQSEKLLEEDTKFYLTYNHTLGTTEGTWGLDLNLTKKQLENGSFKEVLNIDLPDVPDKTMIHEMTVTPTQVRLALTHKRKYSHLPYQNYQLDVGGTILNGIVRDVRGEPNKAELRFEITSLDAIPLATQPATLIAKHRVDDFDGDSNSIRLTDISAKSQSLTSNIAGYPISWTYYLKDNNLYVESVSSDPTFGGVNQTYYLDGKERNYGMPAIFGIIGDDNNQHMDIYENFDKTELDIYIWQYTTHKRDAELRVPLKFSK